MDEKKKTHKIKIPKKIPWRDNAFSMATLYSILTAMVGVLLALIIADKEIKDDWHWPIAMLGVSFICFIWGTEKLSDALDEDDVDKYLAWFEVYNFGVVMMFFGMATYIYLHYQLLFWYDGLLIFVIAFIASLKWIIDFIDLIRYNNMKYDKYRKELKGDLPPEQDRDLIMNIFEWTRRKIHD